MVARGRARGTATGASGRWSPRTALSGVGLTVLLGVGVAGAGPGRFATSPVWGQQGPPVNGRPQVGIAPPEAPGPLAGMNERRLEHLREDERHKRLQADTTKLVELTNELKTEVDKATRDELSLDVVRKAAEIEKLARDVKERMKS